VPVCGVVGGGCKFYRSGRLVVGEVFKVSTRLEETAWVECG
jgi:hypothetical protein